MLRSIIFIAPPAAGKGTQSKMVSKKYNIPHISTGDLLRNAINEQNSKSSLIKEEMQKGNLISDDIILELLQVRLKQDDCQNGYILDGFPRNINQAIKYDEIKCNYLVILLDLDKNLAKQRIIGRLSCKQCGSVYNSSSEELKPKKIGYCDKCDIELSKRIDDNEQTFEERFDTYLKETQPLLDYYEKKGNLYRINSGINKDYTFKQIEEIIGSSI